MNTFLINLIMFYSQHYGMDSKLVIALIQNESQFQVDAVGSVGEIGLMQLLPQSFPDYTKEQLFDPETNIRLGIEYLSKLKAGCKHQSKNTWIVCYNTGPSRAKKIKYPQLFPYYKKVMAIKETQRQSGYQYE